MTLRRKNSNFGRSQFHTWQFGDPMGTLSDFTVKTLRLRLEKETGKAKVA